MYVHFRVKTENFNIIYKLSKYCEKITFSDGSTKKDRSWTSCQDKIVIGGSLFYQELIYEEGGVDYHPVRIRVKIRKYALRS